MHSRARWQRVYWVVAHASSASQKTLAVFSRACLQLSRASSPKPMSNGIRLPAERSPSNALLAALFRVWVTLYINPLTPVLRLSLRLPSRKACVDRTCACSRPLDVFTQRCLAIRCLSTALEWQVPRLLTSGCHLSCCAVWPCLRVRRGCSATSLKSCVTLSHPTSMQLSNGTLSIGQT